MAQVEANVVVQRFWTDYEPARYFHEDGPDKGKARPPRDDESPLREVDWCEYGQPGGTQFTTTVEKVERLRSVIPVDQAPDNGAVILANLRWKAIEPHYTRWKAGHAPTVDGTPLAAWNRLSQPQADTLRMHGISTIEQLAGLSDGHAGRLPIPGARDLVGDAKRFLEASKQSRVETILKQSEEREAAMKAQIEAMQEQIALLSQAPTRRRRSTESTPDEAEAEAA